MDYPDKICIIMTDDDIFIKYPMGFPGASFQAVFNFSAEKENVSLTHYKGGGITYSELLELQDWIVKSIKTSGFDFDVTDGAWSTASSVIDCEMTSLNCPAIRLFQEFFILETARLKLNQEIKESARVRSVKTEFEDFFSLHDNMEFYIVPIDVGVELYIRLSPSDIPLNLKNSFKSRWNQQRKTLNYPDIIAVDAQSIILHKNIALDNKGELPNNWDSFFSKFPNNLLYELNNFLYIK